MDELELERVIGRYNEEVDAGNDLGMKVDAQKAKDLMNELNAMDPNGGLWFSLVYAPRDMSVYVRSMSKHGKFIDVSLCTQDVTYRSDFELKDVQNCNENVGRADDIAAIEFDKLSPIVKHISRHRIVHRVIAYENVITVELARSYRKHKDELNIDLVGFETQLFGESGYGNHERVRNVPPNIIAAWLISMTLMKSETSRHNLTKRREYIERCCKNLKENCMKVNVNYIHMFRARHFRYQDGRITWPCVLGVTTAENLYCKFDGTDVINTPLANLRGTYQGQFGMKNVTACLIQASLLIVASTVVCIYPNEFSVGMVIFLLTFSIPLVNYWFMNDPKPWTMVKRDDREPPSVATLEQATRVLMSDSCKKHFHGRDLCFTGETYEGVNDFAYSFTYEQLCWIGFQRKCDGTGREYLLVPGTGAVVRMDDTTMAADKDHFEVIAQPPHLYNKYWKSCKNPGCKDPTTAPDAAQDVADRA